MPLATGDVERAPAGGNSIDLGLQEIRRRDGRDLDRPRPRIALVPPTPVLLAHSRKATARGSGYRAGQPKHFWTVVHIHTAFFLDWSGG